MEPAADFYSCIGTLPTHYQVPSFSHQTQNLTKVVSLASNAPPLIGLDQAQKAVSDQASPYFLPQLEIQNSDQS